MSPASRSYSPASVFAISLLIIVSAVSFVAAETKEDPYTAGKAWLGESQEAPGNLKNIRLKVREGNRVIFAFQGGAAGAIWTTSGLLSDGVVNLDILNRTTNPAGHESISIKGVSGAARINADGSLNLAVTGRAFGDGPSNRKISVTFINAQAK